MAIHSNYSFKSKVNSSQLKFNAGLQDDIEDILGDKNFHELIVEALNAIVSKISKRNKFYKSCRSFSGRMDNYR